MTLYPPRTDSFPDPDPYPLVTPTVAPAWTPPQPPGLDPTSGMSPSPPPPWPRGRGLAAVAVILSLLALALALSPFVLSLRPVLTLACSVGGLVGAIAGIVCGHAAWSRVRTSGWRTIVIVALIFGYLALALGLFHILALFARELALRRRAIEFNLFTPAH